MLSCVHFDRLGELAMLRYLTTVLAAAVLSWVAVVAAAADLREQTLLNGRAQVSIPSELKLMTDEMKRIKYPTANPPKEVYTDERGTVNVAASILPMSGPAKLDDIVAAMAQAISRVRNVSTWHGKGTRTINGRDFGYLEFTALTLDTEVYSYIYFTLDGGELIMFTVNSTVGKLGAWKNSLKNVVSSTHILASELRRRAVD